MKQLQVTVPPGRSEIVEDILEDYSSDISSSNVEQNGGRAVQFQLTAESDQIDGLTEELKSLGELDQGELSIRVLDQESLIEKGQETRGGSSDLSQQEIYSKAQEFSGFDRADWGLVFLSGIVAASGIAMDNLIVVIGAMMFAPLLSPLVAASISMVVGDRSLMHSSIRTATLAAGVTFLAATGAGFMLDGSGGLLSIFTSPSVMSVALAALVGSAASLTSATGRRDQVAGVAVAIALVPPLAAAGLELSSVHLYQASAAFLVALINMLGILVAGTVTFRLLGLRPDTYYKEIQAKEMWRLVPVAMGVMVIVAYLAWLV